MAVRDLVPALLIASCLGCAGVATRPHDRFAVDSGSAYEGAGTSLFPGDAEVLSDEEIGRILETRVSIPEGARVALLHLDHRSLGRFYTWSNQYGGTAAARRADEALVGDLRASPSIGDAAYLPSLLLPPKRSVPRLREAAARFQCDLLFVYATDCQVYRQYRFFTADEAKARCSAEAALLDVRTGVVPFTAKAEEEFVLEKGDDDAGFAETLERSEAAASQAAVRSAAGSLVDFLAASRR